MEKNCDVCRKLFYFDEYEIISCAGNDEQEYYSVECTHCGEENELNQKNSYMSEAELGFLD